MYAFNSSCESVKYWCIQIASNFPDEKLLPSLIKFLQYEDQDIKTASIVAMAKLALNHIRENEVLKVLQEEVEKISDEEIKEFAFEVLDDIQNNI